MRRIGIMGGTFDPIHFGHLFPAEAARIAFGLDKVLFIPSGQPPHKRSRQVAPQEHRHAMTVLATADNPHFEVCRIELDRKGPSFSIDTIKELKDAYPDSAFHFITGTDAIVEIFTWKDWISLFDLCHFIVATRPGYDLVDFHRQLSEWGREVSDLVKPRVHTLEIPLLDISSSRIREALAVSGPVRYLLPETVYAYMHVHSLYSRS